MTTEHKILTIVDRGAFLVTEIHSLLGVKALRRVSDLATRPRPLIRWESGASVELTARGLDRLNELDEAAT